MRWLSQHIVPIRHLRTGWCIGILSLMALLLLSGVRPAQAEGDFKAGFISPPPKDPQVVLPEAQPEESSEAFEARIQKHIVPRSFLYQQTVFSRYPRYRKKIEPLLDTLKTLARYLQTLDESEAPDIQLLSAKANLLKLHWENLARDIEPHEAEYRSYAHITDAVAGFVNIADYWVQADKNRGINRPTIGAMADDITYWAQMRATVLAEVQALESWQADEAAISHKPSRLPPPPFP
jgi:hypothetical protein